MAAYHCNEFELNKPFDAAVKDLRGSTWFYVVLRGSTWFYVVLRGSDWL